LASLNEQLARIQAHIQKQINDSLYHEIASVTKKEIQNSIDTEIYQSGIPSMYERRGLSGALGSGSLADPNEMDYNVKDGVLRMVDSAERNMSYGDFPGIGYDLSKSLAYNMEYGYGNEWYSKPRPFLKKTIENMRESNSHVIAMRLGLQRRLGKDVVK